MKIRRLLNPHIQKLFMRKIVKKITKEISHNKTPKINTANLKIRNIEMNFNLAKKDQTMLENIGEIYLNHEFEILGSGYTSFNKESNITKYQKYQDLNWDIDIKTGYQWQGGKILNKKEAYNLPKNVDIKNAWDFGRLNHLPQLAILYYKTEKEIYKTEVENVIKDFYLNNPYLYGIQWTSPMDVAIRAINIIFSYYIINSKSEYLPHKDNVFLEIIKKTIFEHGLYIYENLEINFRNLETGNHYLSNIIGLLYISYFLDDSKTKRWWKFSEKEFNNLVMEQFDSDGTYYEGSTNYHRLSTELIILGSSIIIRKNKEIDSKVLNVLIKSAKFIEDTMFNNLSIQIGDNDSGRILKLTPQGEFIDMDIALKKYLNLKNSSLSYPHSNYFDEDLLDYRPTLAMFSGLIEVSDYEDYSKVYSVEHDIIKSVVDTKRKPCKIKTTPWLKNEKKNRLRIKTPRYSQIKTFKNKNIKYIEDSWIVYENLGLVCYKTDNVFISLRLHGNRKKKTGHIHNDVFGLNLIVDDDLLILDPGSFSYTTELSFRDSFREDYAHSTPIYTEKIVELKGVFSTKSNVKKDQLIIRDNYCEYTCKFNNTTHKRRIEINEGKILISDISNDNFIVNYDAFEYYSNGFGKILKRKNFNLNRKRV